MLVWFVATISAVIVSSIARNRVRANPALAGKGRAWAGALIGYANLVLMLAAIAAPNFVKARTTTSKNPCFNNLRQIEAAKKQWALERKKTQTDAPTWDDLVGTDKYIKVMPSCHSWGAYTINDMDTKPKCSIPDHTLL